MIGAYLLSGERFATHVWAQTPRAAEDMVTGEEAPKRDVLGWPCKFVVAAVVAVVDGRAVPVDTYARFLDPNA